MSFKKQANKKPHKIIISVFQYKCAYISNSCQITDLKDTTVSKITFSKEDQNMFQVSLENTLPLICT